MNKKSSVFFLILLLHVIVWLLFKPVWPFSDDYCYALNAYHFITSSFHLTTNPFQNRLGVFVPVGGIFSSFGINPYTINAWPLIGSLLTISAVFYFIKKVVDINTALVSCFVISINILQILYSTALFPDLFIALYSITAILVLYYGREIQPNKRIFPILLIVSLLLGIFTKETILLVFPFIIFVAISDVIHKRHFVFWKRLILYGTLSFIIFLLIYYFLTGDPFFRFKAFFVYINNGPYGTAMHDFILKTQHHNLLKWLNDELAFIFLILFSISTVLTIKKYDLKDLKVFIVLYSFSLLLILSVLFYTDKYGVLFMMDRVWMLIIPPLCILTALFILNTHANFCIVLIILFSFLIYYNFHEISTKRGMLFTFFLLTTLASYYLSRKNKKWNVILLIPFIFLSINFVIGNSNYRAGSIQSSDLMKEQIEILNASGRKTILTDKDFAENHIIYNGFKEYTNLVFYPFTKYDSLRSNNDLYSIVNTEETSIPDFIQKASGEWKVVFKEKKLLIYRKVN